LRILDTDHAIGILRGRLDVRQRAEPQADLAVTAVTVAELMDGAHRSLRSRENISRVEVLVAMLVVLPFDEQAARTFGELKARLERAGQVVSDLALQIASIALEAQTPLLTHNRKHFERVPGLVLQDWLAG
jgi:tRNA(fMet)-specific endonuclease VapC